MSQPVSPKVSIAQLFDDNRDTLGLTWVARQVGGNTEISYVDVHAEVIAGHLNLNHPDRVQVLGEREVKYFLNLDSEARTAAFRKLVAVHPPVLVISDALVLPADLIEAANAAGMPVIAAEKSAVAVIDRLRSYLAKALADSTTLHGVFMDVLGIGVLITGDSGVGKSELALELITRGAGLIADDAVEIRRIGISKLEGSCPPMLKDFLEVRGLGLLNIRTIFGETAVRRHLRLRLLAHLQKPVPGHETERLPLGNQTQEILGVEIRKVVIPVAAGRNLAVLLEAAVRNYVLQLRGINSTSEFIARQRQMLEGTDS